MKRFIKVKNKIYRRYLGDIWGEVILRGRLTRIFVFLMHVYAYMLRNVYFRRAKSLLIRRKMFFIRKLKYNKKLFNVFLTKRLIKMKKYNNFYYKSLNTWKKVFWSHFTTLYYSNNGITLKKSKKLLLPSYLKMTRKSLRTKFFKNKFLEQALKRFTSRSGWRKRKSRSILRLMDDSPMNRRFRVHQYTTWLTCERKFKLDKTSAWWNVRTNLKKISIFYGIENIRKFRYINHCSTTSMSLRIFTVMRLELMVSMLLFRMNLFPNMYFINNFIRLGGVLVNNKIVIYPHRFLKSNDILSIHKFFFKKIFNSFFKKLLSSRWALKRKRRFYIYHKLTTPKIILNAPKYLEINYKILHAILWRPPYKKETIGPYSFPLTSIYEWAISTQTEYK